MAHVTLPGCDGLEVARTARAHAGRGELLLVALTGWGREDDRRRTRDAGFDHHFVKPAEPAEIEARIAELRVRRA